MKFAHFGFAGMFGQQRFEKIKVTIFRSSKHKWIIKLITMQIFNNNELVN